VVNISYGFSRVFECEEKIKRVTGIHPLQDQQFMIMARDAGVRLPFFSSLIHASTNYALLSPSNVNQFYHRLVSCVSISNPFPQPQGLHNTFANVNPHPQQNPSNTGSHGAIAGWDNEFSSAVAHNNM
jgi:hypothetical protein